MRLATPRTRIIGKLASAKKREFVKKKRTRSPVPKRKEAKLTFRLLFISSSVSIKNIATNVYVYDGLGFQSTSLSHVAERN